MWKTAVHVRDRTCVGLSKHLLMFQLSLNDCYSRKPLVEALCLCTDLVPAKYWAHSFCVVISGKRRHETKLFTREEETRITRINMLELFELSMLAEKEIGKSFISWILKQIWFSYTHEKPYFNSWALVMSSYQGVLTGLGVFCWRASLECSLSSDVSHNIRQQFPPRTTHYTRMQTSQCVKHFYVEFLFWIWAQKGIL